MAPADNGYFYKNSPCSLRAILSQLSFTSEPLLKDGSVNRGDTKKSSFLWNGLFCSPWDGDLYFDAMESFDGSDVKGPVLPPIATDKGLFAMRGGSIDGDSNRYFAPNLRADNRNSQLQRHNRGNGSKNVVRNEQTQTFHRPPPPPPPPPKKLQSYKEEQEHEEFYEVTQNHQGFYEYYHSAMPPHEQLPMDQNVDAFVRPPPPPPPEETPVRFIRAGKGDEVEGRRRYEATLHWRKENGIDSILTEPFPDFELIKQHYPHFYHLRGRDGEPVFFEQPPKTNLAAMRAGGVNLDKLLRHYAMVTEFQWQVMEPNDFARSITILDLEGMRMTDFVGECVEYVRKCSEFTGQHYPERAGYVFVVNVPAWFKLIWNVVKPMVDEVTLRKIHILRGKDEIFQALLDKIPIENIPPEYGGQSMPLGHSPQEQLLRDWIQHNNNIAHGDYSCGGTMANPPCRFCTWCPARSY